MDTIKKALFEDVFLTVLANVENGTLDHYFYNTAEEKKVIKTALDYQLSKYLAKDGQERYSYINYLGEVQETPYIANFNEELRIKIYRLERDWRRAQEWNPIALRSGLKQADRILLINKFYGLNLNLKSFGENETRQTHSLNQANFNMISIMNLEVGKRIYGDLTTSIRVWNRMGIEILIRYELETNGYQH